MAPSSHAPSVCPTALRLWHLDIAAEDRSRPLRSLRASRECSPIDRRLWHDHLGRRRILDLDPVAVVVAVLTIFKRSNGNYIVKSNSMGRTRDLAARIDDTGALQRVAGRQGHIRDRAPARSPRTRNGAAPLRPVRAATSSSRAPEGTRAAHAALAAGLPAIATLDGAAISGQ